MQIARFRSNGRPRYGIVDGDTIIEAQGSPFHGPSISPDWLRPPSPPATARYATINNALNTPPP